jgi:hypothetical protein
MNTIFTLGDETDENVKINLDDLYERKKQQDLSTLSLYKRILGRIHTKIKTVSRQQTKEQYCWFVMPETIIGVPKYDHGACTAFVIDSLKENGFIVKYTHPNLLLISWASWCPSYVRSEIKKKTGVVIDGAGNRLDLDDDGKVIPGGNNGNNSNNSISDDPNELIFHRGKNGNGNTSGGVKANKEYTSIDTYKPSGLIYNENLLKRIQDITK